MLLHCLKCTKNKKRLKNILKVKTKSCKDKKAEELCFLLKCAVC